MNKIIKKIAFVGPESTGKTTISNSVAKKFSEPWVNEIARDYLQANGPKYSQSDIYAISVLQLQRENELLNKSDKFLFCDTNLLVSIVWSQFVFGGVSTELNNLFVPHSYSHYFLCNIDVPWQYDPLREHPNQREELFLMYQSKLEKYKVSYSILSGSNEYRLQQASKIILTL
jgi:nicotinamide riboside kinase